LAKADANADEIKKSTESLMQNSMKLGEAIYKNSQNPQPNQQAEADSTQASNNESTNEESGKVVDGEYEVKDDKKS
jgi:molecular chaperone DnaK